MHRILALARLHAARTPHTRRIHAEARASLRTILATLYYATPTPPAGRLEALWQANEEECDLIDEELEQQVFSPTTARAPLVIVYIRHVHRLCCVYIRCAWTIRRAPCAWANSAARAHPFSARMRNQSASSFGTRPNSERILSPVPVPVPALAARPLLAPIMTRRSGQSRRERWRNGPRLSRRPRRLSAPWSRLRLRWRPRRRPRRRQSNGRPQHGWRQRQPANGAHETKVYVKRCSSSTHL